jgi:hypothetical protein
MPLRLTALWGDSVAFFLDCLTSKMSTVFPWNFRNYSLNHTVPHPRRYESSATPLWEHCISQLSTHLSQRRICDTKYWNKVVCVPTHWKRLCLLNCMSLLHQSDSFLSPLYVTTTCTGCPTCSCYPYWVLCSLPSGSPAYSHYTCCLLF